LATLLKEHFGPRSERQATPAGEEPPKEPAASEPSAAGPAEARPKRGQKQGAPGHGRGQYAELPAVVVRHECKPEECRCKNCGTEFEAIAGPKTSQEVGYPSWRSESPVCPCRRYADGTQGDPSVFGRHLRMP
jgi:hypothetical protein